ncbi:MAG: beta-ketoacyl-ACP reductase [Gammaproteobacteria bacterium 39-13]|nr:acetoacetyl-CoA reductase [Gammaproteobacteria bacterium]OJV90410.1 MAG: beta-ketoacyl-ACP reductase [Gammaproteobacteria bacterium 39-13]
MKKRIALVTGGTGGIGTAVCRHLHDQGRRVIAGYSRGGDKSFALAWQTSQQEQGYDFEIVYGDVTNYQSCATMLDEIGTQYGAVDILVNNAGITRDSTFRKMSPEQWHEVIKVNLDSLYNVTQHVINGMIERGFGRIINISSINGQKGQFGQANYSAAKAGMHGFTKALAQEVAAKGITVNTVSPGYVATEMVSKMPPGALEKIVAQIPLGRLAEPREVGHVVAFLAAEESSYITGANIAINGGQHMF